MCLMETSTKMPHPQTMIQFQMFVELKLGYLQVPTDIRTQVVIDRYS